MTTLHLLSLGFVIGVTALADKEALAWLRGRKQTLDASLLHSFHLLVWLGLSLLIVSGIFLLYPLRLYLLTEPLFIIKLLFVGILVVNGILIGRLQYISTTTSYTSLRWSEKLPLFVSGTVSVFSWVGAIALALYLFGL